MPAIVVQRGSSWVVLSHRGKGAKKLGTHDTKKEAQAQVRAVNRSLSERGKL